MVQRIFLYFFDKKREGLAFERLKFASPLPTGYEGERLGQNHWTDMPQGTRNESCGHIGKWTSGL